MTQDHQTDRFTVNFREIDERSQELQDDGVRPVEAWITAMEEAIERLESEADDG